MVTGDACNKSVWFDSFLFCLNFFTHTVLYSVWLSKLTTGSLPWIVLFKLFVAQLSRQCNMYKDTTRLGFHHSKCQIYHTFIRYQLAGCYMMINGNFQSTSTWTTVNATLPQLKHVTQRDSFTQQCCKKMADWMTFELL